MTQYSTCHMLSKLVFIGVQQFNLSSQKHVKNGQYTGI